MTYDWFTDPDNFQKVIEGNYKERRKPKPGSKPLSVMEEMEIWI